VSVQLLPIRLRAHNPLTLRVDSQAISVYTIALLTPKLSITRVICVIYVLYMRMPVCALSTACVPYRATCNSIVHFQSSQLRVLNDSPGSVKNHVVIDFEP